MCAVKLAFIKKMTNTPVHLIGCADNSTGGVAFSGLNNRNGLSQYFFIFRFVMKTNDSFHIQS